jgi:hypothetical protein
MTATPRSSRTLWLILLLCAAPVLASYLAYFGLHPDQRTNYGELIPPAPAPELRGLALDGTPFSLSALQGKWVLVHADDASCADACQRKLYATRQARTLQNTEADRILRVWLIPTGAATPPATLLAQHPGLQVARIEPAALAPLVSWSEARAHIYLIDPLGNLMMRFPADPDIKALKGDLAKLLKASRIG